LDSRGVLSLVGRRTEMYIRGGYNVYPAEVEHILGEHPLVSSVAVCGVPDERLGEIGVAWIVPNRDQEIDVADMREWVRASLADYKAPDRVLIVLELPLTSMLKVDKIALRRMWEHEAQPSE
jgi:acyl-CoA synthetase (AMP-forming)/AMP-acid ligase II